ncbi:hypothetical protein ABZ904_42080 [Streptomyces sp. NPDC046900]|uniref:hypothetical protein n=1 Tax=Streptomyces sp. NPDC046900 TaxID=3155473 RepID=UPI0033D6C694
MGLRSGYAGNTTLEPLPLGYRVCSNLAGRAQRQGEISVGASHLPGARGAAPSRAVTLEVSFDDGAAWHRTWRQHGGDAWRGRLNVPRGPRFAGVRATTRDAEGNSVSRTVVRVVGLKGRRLTGVRPRRRAPAPGRVGR